MFRAESPQYAVSDQGVSIEFTSLDSIIYENNEYKVLLYVEHCKQPDGEHELYIDLSNTNEWMVPQGQSFDIEDKKIAAEQLQQGLKALGLKTTVEVNS